MKGVNHVLGVDKLSGVIAMYLTFVLPFAVWTLSGFLLGVPKELEESAMVDGATRFGAFVRILLPLVGPGLVATSIFAFIQAWNEFIIAYVFLHTPQKQTLMVWLASFTTLPRNGLGPSDGRRHALLAAGDRLLPPCPAADRVRPDRRSGEGVAMAEIELSHVSKLFGDTLGRPRPEPSGRRGRVRRARRPVRVRQDDRAAHRRRAGGDQRGEIRIGDRIVNDLAPRERDIAMVFQNYALYPHKTVYENLAFGLRMRKVPKAEQKTRVEEIARVLGLGDMLKRRPAQLSGGQRQRVAMGRAIVREPKAFLMDEPLSNLDAKLRVQMRAEIARIQQTLKVTTLYVTHDQVEAMTMGDRVAVMRDGVLQQVDTPQRLYDAPGNLFVASFVDRRR